MSHICHGLNTETEICKWEQLTFEFGWKNSKKDDEKKAVTKRDLNQLWLSRIIRLCVTLFTRCSVWCTVYIVCVCVRACRLYLDAEGGDSAVLLGNSVPIGLHEMRQKCKCKCNFQYLLTQRGPALSRATLKFCQSLLALQRYAHIVLWDWCQEQMVLFERVAKFA